MDSVGCCCTVTSDPWGARDAENTKDFYRSCNDKALEAARETCGLGPNWKSWNTGGPRQFRCQSVRCPASCGCDMDTTVALSRVAKWARAMRSRGSGAWRCAETGGPNEGTTELQDKILPFNMW